MISYLGVLGQYLQSRHFFILLVSEAVFLNIIFTVELQWLEHLWNHENMFETWVVRANECYL